MSIQKSVGQKFKSYYDFLHRYDRGGSELINAHPSYSLEKAGAYIARSFATWKTNDSGETTRLTYSFIKESDKSIEKLFSEKGLGELSEFNQQQKEQAKLSLQSWADVANISFSEARSGIKGDITFGNFSSSIKDIGAFAFYPNDKLYNGQTWFSVSTNSSPVIENYARSTLTHEIGHALGLKHPGPYNSGVGNPTYADARYAEDTQGYSIMSYWSETHTQQSFAKSSVWSIFTGKNQAYPAAPMIDDIYAIQKKYGANNEARTGDTTYGFNSNTERDFYSINSQSDKPVFAVWDAGGNDTFDFSGFSHEQRVNLNEQSFSDVGGMRGNVSIAKGVTIENAIGGSGDDIIIGNKVSNDLRGGNGGDVIFGGEGADILFGGGGRDIFLYEKISDSLFASPDQIMDFTKGQDKIDISKLLQSNGGLSIEFVEQFTGKSGESVLTYDRSENHGSLSIDFSGNGITDFRVEITGQAFVSDIIA